MPTLDVLLIEYPHADTLVVTTPEVMVVSGGEAGPIGPPGECIVDTLVYAAAPAIDWDGVDEWRVALTGNFAPTFFGAADGQRCVLTITQDGTGSRLVTLPANVSFSTDITTFTASTVAGRTDMLGFIYNATTEKYRLVATSRGFSS